MIKCRAFWLTVYGSNIGKALLCHVPLRLVWTGGVDEGAEDPIHLECKACFLMAMLSSMVGAASASDAELSDARGMSVVWLMDSC